MTWAHQQLGLPSSASPRDVKRAYAQRLKKTRPQDDAEGFQRLKAAYDFALQWAENQEEATKAPLIFEFVSDQAPEWREAKDEVDPRISEPVFAPSTAIEPPPSPEPQAPAPASIQDNQAPLSLEASEPETHGVESNHSSPPTRSTPYEIAEQLLHTCGSEQFPEAEAFSQWLQDHPDFWSLSFKSEVAATLPRVFHRFESPIPEGHLEALWGFFGLNQVGAGSGYQSTVIFEEKKRHLDSLWLKIHANYQSIFKKWKLHVGHFPEKFNAFESNYLLLKQELELPKSILSSFKWNHVSNIAEVASWLETQVFSTASLGLNMEHIQFWRRVGNPHRYSHERMLITMAQAAAIWLLPALLFIIANLFEPFSSFNSRGFFNIFEASSIFATIFFLVKLTWAPIFDFHLRSVQYLGRLAWLRFAIVSVLMSASILTVGANGYIKLFQFISTSYTLMAIYLSFMVYEKFSPETRVSISTVVFLSMLLFMFFSGMTITSLAILYSTWLISFFYSFRSIGEFRNQMFPTNLKPRPDRMV